MFDWLREIKDNIVAEIDLATADPSPELCASVKRAMENEDADLCGEINDSTSWLGHGRILGDMEAAGLSIDDPVDEIAKAIGWSQDQVRETVKTERFIRFLKEKMYVKDQIRQMGVIANHLKKNKNNIDKTAAQCNVAKEYVNTVLKLLEEFESSEYKEIEMMRKICCHKDFGRRNPVDIGIECGYLEVEVLQMLHKLEKK